MSFYNNQPSFVSKEMRLSRSVMGLNEKDAVKTIEQNGLVAFIEQRDKSYFKPHSPTAHSYRIKLTVRNGRVISTDIG